MAVVLHTSAGDLPILLHYRACPKASLNFIALCASGYYDQCSFYRHFKGILLQSGDPTNTGKGGEAVFARLSGVPGEVDTQDGTSGDYLASAARGVQPGRYFEDEGFGTVSHAQRGVLSMAHKGTKPDTNAAQFFILLSPQTAFDGVYTAFGQVDVDGWYDSHTRAVAAVSSQPEKQESPSGGDVLSKLEELADEVDGKGMVANKGEVVIHGTTVLFNPFAEGLLSA